MEVYLATAALLALSLLVGGALCSIGREDGGWDWLAPAVGLAAVLVLSWVCVRLPGRGATAAVLLGLAALASAVSLRGRLLPRHLAEGVPPVALTLLLASLPFIANRRIGAIGQSLNDDLSFHLLWADGLAAPNNAVDLIPDGYPVGPHSLAGVVAELLGTSAEPVFIALLLAVPALGALTALAALAHLAPWRRMLAAPLVGVAYVVGAFLLQANFKELLVGLFLLALAVVLGRFAHGEMSPRRATALGALLTAAGCMSFSLPALAWFVSGAVAALAVHAIVTRGRPTLRAILVVVGGATALVVGGVAFEAATGFFSDGPGRFAFGNRDPSSVGNLREPLSPFQALSVWPSSDFRMDPTSGWWRVGVAVAVVAALVGTLRAAARREIGLVSVSAVAVAIYAVAAPVTGYYNSAKALAILAPVVTATALAGLLAPVGERRSRPLRLALAGLAVAWVALAVHSSVTLLRAGFVRPEGQSTEMAKFREDVRGREILFVGGDPYANWELRTAAHVTRIGSVDATGETGRLQPGGPSLPVVRGPSRVILARTLYAPSPSPSTRRLRTTRWYRLLSRAGRSGRRLVARNGGEPGAIFRCDREADFLARSGWMALVRPEPVMGSGDGWGDPTGRRRRFTPDGTVTLLPPRTTLTQELRLPPGRWEISLRYYSSTDLRVSAGGLSVTMPAYLANRYQHWRVGSVRVRGGGPVTVEVSSPPSRRIEPQRTAELFTVVAVREDRPPHLVPLRRACGRYTDYVLPPVPPAS